MIIILELRKHYLTVRKGKVMNKETYISKIDHTALKPTTKWEDIKELCDEAIEFKTASVCIPPSFVKKVKQTYKSKLNICTVIGFPLGYNTTEVKIYETKCAIEDGADEIDMVINIGEVKDGNFEKVTQEIILLKQECMNRILKVIIETCYLTESEIIKLCQCVTDAGADFIKTSTGFGSAGAKVSDVKLMKENIGEAVRIKAAGGIRDFKSLEEFVSAGANRIGCSATSNIMKEI